MYLLLTRDGVQGGSAGTDRKRIRTAVVVLRDA